MTAIISVADLQKAYGVHRVLKGVTFEVEKGTIFALLGSNGAGKTTAVRILSTLILPDAGQIKIGGYDVIKQDHQVRKIISLTGQYAAVDELLTGEENMFMMGRFSHISSKTVRKRTTELLEQLDLVEAAKRQARTYSGGMRRRLDLAISLLANPPVIFLDEPTTGLDPRSRQEIWRLTRELVAGGTTIFLTTQYLEEADQLADKIAVLNNGTIVAEGTARTLKQQIGGAFLELTFANAHEYETAKDVVDGKLINADSSNQSLRITTDGTPEDVRDILNRLAKKDIKAGSMSLREPTLDDVFMKLTAINDEGKANE